MSEVTGMVARDMLGMALVRKHQKTHHDYGCPRGKWRDMPCFCHGGPMVFVREAHFIGAPVANEDGTTKPWRPPGKAKPLGSSRPLSPVEGP